ncbi:branched-chain amino acid transport system II carrier protein, partial [Staphylococcus aureus]|nr:branched-chain amino acid transport system II carrier protein [Staphylococcus aureus]
KISPKFSILFLIIIYLTIGPLFAIPRTASTSFEMTITPIIHSDAAYPGQGINFETMNLGNLKGYSTGGSLHIITNNRIGFTTEP